MTLWLPGLSWVFWWKCRSLGARVWRSNCGSGHLIQVPNCRRYTDRRDLGLHIQSNHFLWPGKVSHLDIWRLRSRGEVSCGWEMFWIQMIGLRPEFVRCCGAGSQRLLMFHHFRNCHVMRAPSSPYHYQEGRGLLPLFQLSLPKLGVFSEGAPKDRRHIERLEGAYRSPYWSIT